MRKVDGEGEWKIGRAGRMAAKEGEGRCFSLSLVLDRNNDNTSQRVQGNIKVIKGRENSIKHEDAVKRGLNSIQEQILLFCSGQSTKYVSGSHDVTI